MQLFTTSLEPLIDEWPELKSFTTYIAKIRAAIISSNLDFPICMTTTCSNCDYSVSKPEQFICQLCEQVFHNNCALVNKSMPTLCNACYTALDTTNVLATEQKENMDTQICYCNSARDEDIIVCAECKNSFHLSCMLIPNAEIASTIHIFYCTFCRQETSKSCMNNNNMKLYCTCFKPYDGLDGDMLGCSLCHNWFHVACVKETPKSDEQDYMCQLCRMIALRRKGRTVPCSNTIRLKGSARWTSDSIRKDIMAASEVRQLIPIDSPQLPHQNISSKIQEHLLRSVSSLVQTFLSQHLRHYQSNAMWELFYAESNIISQNPDNILIPLTNRQRRTILQVLETPQDILPRIMGPAAVYLDHSAAIDICAAYVRFTKSLTPIAECLRTDSARNRFT